MEKQGAKTVVPKLRFPEFRASAEWEVHELQSIAHLAKGVQLSSSLKDDAAKFPHFNGGVTYSSRTGRANRDANTTIISEGGNSCGYVQFVDEPFWCGGHCYSIVPKRPDQNRYLFYVLQARQKEIMGLRVGSGLPNIPKNVLEKFEVAFAKDSFEQQKIADCLTSLDEVIAAQGRKVEALKAHKRGLIQQLFPREGETRPRLRFPEYRDAPEWGSDLVSTLISTVTPPRKIPTSGYGAEGLLPIVDQSPDPVCGWTDDMAASIDDPLPLIVFGDHTCVLKLVEHAFAQGADGIKIISSRPCIRIRFLYYALQLDPISSSSYRRHFSLLQEKRVAFPEDLAEQQRIADCLSSLDTKIAAETHQLAALKAHKQGLMQQLFPAPEQG